MAPMIPGDKYKPYKPIDLPNRSWPSKIQQKTPIWTSVDLRDGNQALINPMSGEQKLKFYQKLVEVGFKEIEVAFPLRFRYRLWLRSSHHRERHGPR